VTGAQLIIGGPTSACHSGPHNVRLGAFDARVPHGWYYAMLHTAQVSDLWIGDQRGCAGLRPMQPAAHKVFLVISQVSGLPVTPGQRIHHAALEIRPSGNALRWLHSGFYDRLIPANGSFYDESVAFGRRLRNAEGLALANTILGRIKQSAG
jgi:hypothetical protein